MRLILLFCSVCLLMFASGCKRSGQQSTNNNSGPTDVSNGLSGGQAEAKSLLEKGKQLYRDDQDTDAVAAFEQAVKLDPNLAEAYFRLGLGYEALEKREEAETQYKKAVEAYKKHLDANPDDSEAHYNLGQTYANLAQYSDAIREYR